jgi:hypothetical protein
MQLKNKDRIKFFVIFWGITAFFGLYFIPAVLLAMINPFWFRDRLLNALTHQIREVCTWRSKQVKPIVDKYVTFEILKNKQLGA